MLTLVLILTLTLTLALTNPNEFSWGRVDSHHIRQTVAMRNYHFYYTSYNTCKDRWRITSNGDDSNDDNDNDNENDRPNDNNKNFV